MKICKLKLKNLNSFREPVEIDFQKSPLNDASLVAITGPTGSGKTTLLDAICVALYGKTPRLSGTMNQHPRHLISHGETEGFAEVYFQANNTRYHATWSIKGKGAPKGQLFDGSGELITTKVAQEVESILGLDFGAFKRSVMLAQGEFAAFLKASKEDRRTILEATAGISIYDILKQALNDKVSEVEAANAEVYDKLNKIPEASREQLTDAEAELDRLQTKVEALGEKNQQIQREKDRETKRKEEFEKLQSSEKRQGELADQQPEIDALKSERELAEKAERLLPEKQALDSAKSELENATAALSSAETEKTEAEEQVKTDQAVFEEKAKAHQDASGECDRRVEIYIEAKSDVEWAEDRFTEAEKRTPDLADLSNQIDALESQLNERQDEKAQLQKQIDGAQRFLADNPLPSDRQQRLNRTTGLLAQLDSQEKQLETASTSKTQHEKKVSSLKQEIKKLSNTHAGYLSEKADAETALENATADLNALLKVGSREEWAARTQQAAKAQPIAQKYEATQDNLVDVENQLNTLNETAAELAAELEQIETDWASQTDVYQRAAETVQRCEAERESAKWANSINQLRQHLHAGEPCRVCGATEHPYTAIMEDENEDLLQNAENALAAAKVELKKAETERETLKTKRIQIEENKRNTADQIETGTTEVETLQENAAELLTEWQAIYPDADVSSKWASEQFIEANTAITAIGDAEKDHTQTSHAYQTASQQLETCENDIARETELLIETEQQLEDVGDDVENLKVTIKDLETGLSDLLPKVFHGVPPKEAVDQFGHKIEEVASREDEQRKAETQLQLVETNIEADQSNLKNLTKRNEVLQVEIGEYRREGEAFLNTVREKTGGLETEDEINTAIDALASQLQAKENERDAAERQLQESQKLSTQKQTAHEICEKQHGKSDKKFGTARQTYFDKLRDIGFDSPEEHDNAFRDEDQTQKLTDQINAHATETQQLALEITELQTRFEETPFDPDALGQIEIQLEAIEAQLQEAQQGVGAQQQKIEDLKDALEKREALGDQLGAVQQDLERWQRLQETIPANALRDFALEIMFKQMGSLANEQLKYLTSERYQLKVETIGDLTVVDRWNANEERPVETLSGGESFLTSLALALALSELSRGRSQLNSLFLDEGFGTLDAETLDIAIAALEGLRMQGRNIFLISHIQELTRRLPVKINVRKQGNGSSSVDIRG